ncbi:hypothetical protein SCG7109_BM_00040 [Chlamydiales bacterium SCGC AG-110-M15]|nr:hypothetical protein SCG7109_BM_00040 [Chlamydiales bacterium SCGC AG-110-M15]
MANQSTGIPTLQELCVKRLDEYAPESQAKVYYLQLSKMGLSPYLKRLPNIIATQLGVEIIYEQRDEGFPGYSYHVTKLTDLSEDDFDFLKQLSPIEKTTFDLQKKKPNLQLLSKLCSLSAKNVLIMRRKYLRNPFFYDLWDSLTSAPNIENIDFFHNSLDCKCIKMITRSLLNQQFKDLKHLNLASNGFEDEGLYALCDFLEQEQNRLVSLHLGNNNISSVALKKLLNSLCGNTTMEFLDLSFLPFDEEASKLLCEVIDSMTGLKRLRLNGYKFNLFPIESSRSKLQVIS